MLRSGLLALLAAVLLTPVLLLAGCSAPTATVVSFQVLVEVDGKQIPVQVPEGTTSQGALDQAGITLNNLDQVIPPSYTILTGSDVVRVTRVREVFTVEEQAIPFDRQTVHNESLPEGRTMLVQRGVNGVEQVTYRQVFEDDREVSKNVFKSETLVASLPEILMVGVQKPFTPVSIPGKLAYLSAGNAWLMEGSTRERRPLITTGDLDGRVFSISPKGDWLLFTRAGDGTGSANSAAAPAAEAENQAGPINTLWALNLAAEDTRPVNLKVANVIHFADWVPGQGLTIAYSTVEPRQTAPGWQANNDLHLLTFAPTGTAVKQETVLEANSGGMYGWWGTTFAWSPDGARLAYAQPAGVGLVDFQNQALTPLVDILPFQTGADWAWTPGLGWSADGRVLYLVNHAARAGMQSDETSPLFDLAALALSEPAAEGAEQANEDDVSDIPAAGPLIPVAAQAGMFAYPVPAPAAGSQNTAVAYLNAIFPEQSGTKRYRLAVIDRDGSNRAILFPAEDRQGLDPQRVAWSPAPLVNGNLWIAVNYQGSLWLVDSATGEGQPVTGDGLIQRLDWK